MSMRVVGLMVPTNSEYQAILALKRACDAVEGAKYPEVVGAYFKARGGCPEDEESALEVELPTTKWGAEMREGFEVVVADIPDGVKTLRFYCSW